MMPGAETAGRFINREMFAPTADYISGMNLYEYVLSSPVNYNDPTGLDRRVCFFWGHGYLEIRDSAGRKKILQFGPGWFGGEGYNIYHGSLPTGVPITGWCPTTDAQDDRLVSLWEDLEKDRRCGKGSSWNPSYNCWVPVLMFEDYGAPRPPTCWDIPGTMPTVGF